MKKHFIILLLFTSSCTSSSIIRKIDSQLTGSVWRLEKIKHLNKSVEYSTDSIYAYLSFTRTKKERGDTYRTGHYFIFTTERDSTSPYYLKLPLRGYYDINLSDRDLYMSADTASEVINHSYIRLDLTQAEFYFNRDIKTSPILQLIFKTIMIGRAGEGRLTYKIENDKLIFTNAMLDTVVFKGVKRVR